MSPTQPPLPPAAPTHDALGGARRPFHYLLSRPLGATVSLRTDRPGLAHDRLAVCGRGLPVPVALVGERSEPGVAHEARRRDAGGARRIDRQSGGLLRAAFRQRRPRVARAAPEQRLSTSA